MKVNNLIDLDHLSQQTAGSKLLEKELLELFSTQIDEISVRIPSASHDELQMLAHKLKGSALVIGADSIVACADAVGNNPENPAKIADLINILDRTKSLITSIC